MIDKSKFIGWLNGHNVLYDTIAEVCGVSIVQAVRWIHLHNDENIPELDLKVLWNYLEHGIVLEDPAIE